MTELVQNLLVGAAFAGVAGIWAVERKLGTVIANQERLVRLLGMIDESTRVKYT